jgi:hypothetical protein
MHIRNVCLPACGRRVAINSHQHRALRFGQGLNVSDNIGKLHLFDQHISSSVCIANAAYQWRPILHRVGLADLPVSAPVFAANRVENMQLFTAAAARQRHALWHNNVHCHLLFP